MKSHELELECNREGFESLGGEDFGEGALVGDPDVGDGDRLVGVLGREELGEGEDDPPKLDMLCERTWRLVNSEDVSFKRDAILGEEDTGGGVDVVNGCEEASAPSSESLI